MLKLPLLQAAWVANLLLASAELGPPPWAARVSGAVPVLVAATQTEILWYPLNSATVRDAEGNTAILMRAQSCPDVNTNTTDTAFVSYTNGSSWASLGPQPVQERLCYPYPPGSASSVMCLPSVDAGLDHSASASQNSTSRFLGTVWELRAGNLAKDLNRTAVPITFDYSAAPPRLLPPQGSFMTMFSDGVGAVDAGGKGVLLPIMAAAQPKPPPRLTAACRRMVVSLCPGVQVHGAVCSACILAHAAQLSNGHCPPAIDAANYAYYCSPGTPLPDMLFTSEDGLHFSYRSSVRDPASHISGATDTGSENALLRLGDGRLMIVMRCERTFLATDPPPSSVINCAPNKAVQADSALGAVVR